MTRVSLIALALVAAPCALAADCDMQGKCYSEDGRAPPQRYHMDLAHPDLETPPPAPQYPCKLTSPSVAERRRPTAALSPEPVDPPPYSPLPPADLHPGRINRGCGWWPVGSDADLDCLRRLYREAVAEREMRE